MVEDRRPIASREMRVWKALASLLVRAGVSPNGDFAQSTNTRERWQAVAQTPLGEVRKLALASGRNSMA